MKMKSNRTILGAVAALLATAAIISLSPAGETNLARAAGLSRAERAKQEAEFMNNFLSFVEWPGKAFYDSNAPAVLCVVGKSPFGTALDKYAAGKDGPRPLAVREVFNLAVTPSCHMIYISNADKGRVKEILGSFGESAVLTMSEIEGFADTGGMIEFGDDGRGVRLKVNQKNAQLAGFTISSKLLRVATVVGQ